MKKRNPNKRPIKTDSAVNMQKPEDKTAVLAEQPDNNAVEVEVDAVNHDVDANTYERNINNCQTNSESEIQPNSEVVDSVIISNNDGEVEPTDAVDNSQQSNEVAEVAEVEEVAEEASRSKKAISLIKKFCKRYFIDAFSGMAQGLFCTLIAGTILGMVGNWIKDAGTDSGIAVGKFVLSVANIAKTLMGAGIGIGIAHALKAKKLVLFTAAVAGFVGAFADKIIAGNLALTLGAPGNPIGSYVVAVLAIEIGNLVCGKTKVDIVVVPLTMMIVSMLSCYVSWPFIQLVNVIGKGVALATTVTPEAMGIIVAVVMGILLTLPTSSAAIWVAIAAPVIAGNEVGSDMYNAILLAGGAATVGCACQMVGFAVESFRENKFGGLIAQGLGTSMLQIPNLMRHPQIIIPPVIASIIAGPLSTCVFELRCGASGGGMGTSGLVGMFDVIEQSKGAIPDWKLGLGIVLCMFVIPTVVCIAVSELMRKKKWIKPEHLKLDL